MAIAVDSSSPARFSGSPTTGGSITSASFTAPADALLVVCLEADAGTSETLAVTASDSGGLTWTTRVERNSNETTTGGYSGIFTARTTSSASRTVSLTRSGSSQLMSAKVYVVTGADVDGTPVDTVGASNEGGSNSNNLTTSSITPGANGLLFAADADWNALGTFQSSSNLTQNTAHYSGLVSVCDGYRTVTSGVAATANLNAAGTSAAQHKWCQIVVREAAGASTVDGSATLAATASVSSSGQNEARGSATLGAVASLACAAAITVLGSATLPSVASLTASGTRQVSGSATLATTASLSATSQQEAVGAATLPAVASVTAAGVRQATGTASLPTVASLAGSAQVEVRAAASLPTVASLVASGDTAGATITGDAALASSASLTAQGRQEALGSSALPAISSVTASGTREVPASAALGAVASLASTGRQEGLGSASLPAVASLSSSARVEQSASASLPVVASVAASSEGQVTGTATLPTTVALSASARQESVSAVAPLAAHATIFNGVALTWENATGIVVEADGSVRKTAVTAWNNAGADSVETFTGDVSVRWSILDASGYVMAGLSGIPGNQPLQSADFAVYVYPPTGNLLFYSSGVFKGQSIGYAAGDVIRLDRVGSVVKAYRNDTLVWTFADAPDATLQFEAIFYRQDSVLAPVTVSGAGTRVETFAASTLAATASVSASALAETSASATLPVVASLSATPEGGSVGTAALAVTASLSATGRQEAVGAASLPATATLAASGLRQANGTASLPAVASLASSGRVERAGAAALASTASVSASGRQEALGGATLGAAFSVSASADSAATQTGDAALPAVAGLSAAAAVDRIGVAALPAAATVTASAVLTTSGSAALPVVAAVSASSAGESTGGASLGITASLSAAGTRQREGAAALATTVGLSASGLPHALASSALATTASLSASGRTEQSAVAALPCAATLSATAWTATGADALLRSFVGLEAAGTLGSEQRVVTADLRFAVDSAAALSFHPGSFAQSVEWTDVVNCSASGWTLTRTTGTGDLYWQGGARGVLTLAGDGWAEFSTPSAPLVAACGLTADLGGTSYATIDYAFFFWSNGNAYIYENGTNVAGAFKVGVTSADRFRVAVEGGVVRYYVNGTLVRTAPTPPSTPLYVDAGIDTIGASLSAAVYGAAETRSPVELRFALEVTNDGWMEV